MGRRFLQWSGLGVAAALAFGPQPATAGERETAAVQIHHRGPSVQSVALVNRSEDRGLRIENGGRFQSREVKVESRTAAGGQRTEVERRRTEVGVGNTGHGEFSFVPVTPLRPEVRDHRTEVGTSKQGPSTSPRERKSITFFRLDPKLGDVSVQPVVGGVNGAQLSVGF